MTECDPALRFRDDARRLLRRARRRALARGAAQAGAGLALLTAWCALLLGWPAAAAAPVRFAAVAAWWLGVAWLIADLVAAPLAELGGLARFCASVDRRCGCGNRLVAAEEAARRPERWRASPLAAELARRVVAAAGRDLAVLDPARAAGLPPRRVAAARCLLVAAALALGWVLVGPVLERGLLRLARPGLDGGPPPPSGLFLEAAEVRVVSGADARLVAVDFGSSDLPVACEVRSERGAWRALDAGLEPAAAPSPGRRFAARLAGAREDLIFRFRRGGFATAEGRLRVLQPPLPLELELAVAPPTYTGLPPQSYPQAPPRLEVPAGSRLEWRGRANHELARAAMVTAAGDTFAWEVTGREFAGGVTATAPFVWRLLLRDAAGLRGLSDAPHEVAVLADRAPVAELERPGGGDDLPGDGRLALAARAGDDYGLAHLDLLLRREDPAAPQDTAWVRLPVLAALDGPVSAALAEGAAGLTATAAEVPAPDRLACFLDLDVSQLEFVPGQALAVQLEARDNRRPGAPGRGRSRVLRFTLPSAAELLAEHQQGERQRLEDLAELRRQGGDLREELARLERELKKDPLPDFARRQEIDEALARQKALQAGLEELTGRMREDLDRLAASNLASVELVERLDQVAALMDEIRDDNLERLREQLQDAMSRLGEREVQDAVADVARRQQEFLDRLERAASLLEQMKREQEMAALTAELEQMMREQSQLMEGERDAEAAARQQALSEAVRELEQKLRDALAELGEEKAAADGSSAPPEPSPSGEPPSAEAMREALEAALAELESGDLQEALREAAGSLKSPSGPPPESASSQQEAMRRLASLYNVLLQGQQAMQMAMQNFAGEAMRRLAFDLLEISRRQEELAAAIPADLRDVRAPHLARDQKRLLRATAALRGRLETALGSSGAIPFRVLQQLDKLVEGMQPVVASLDAGWGQPARDGARGSLGQINQLVMNLLTSAQMAGGGGGGAMSMPMPSLSQKLEQMAREQAGLNGLAEQLRRQQGERGLSQQLRAQMQRLQSGQQGVARGMGEAAELQRDAPEGDRILGDLRDLARDLEGVAASLAAGEIDEATLQRQERILGRMLDARNSVRKRDFSRRRESRAAEEVLARQQGGDGVDPAPAEESPWRLRAEQLDRVPAEYRDVVRRYFETLQEIDARRGTGAADPEVLP
ncbi:MAG: DUF4175 family protein [bacterium]|nr:DUF4175 family protein [bacterium]